MENKDLRTLRSNAALVPSTDDPKKILRYPKETMSYSTALSEMSSCDTPAGPFHAVSMVGNDRRTTAFRGSLLTPAERNSLVATEIRNLDEYALKNAMMQRIEETLVKAIDMGISAADTAVKNAFFRCIEIALNHVDQQGVMDKVIHTSLERWTWSDIRVSRIAKEMCRHPVTSHRDYQS